MTIESASAIGVPAFIAACFVWLLLREDAALRRRAQRARLLELEALGELRGRDAYPEEAGTSGSGLVNPDGTLADARSVLRHELAHTREHATTEVVRHSPTRSVRGWKGAKCQV